MNFKIFIFLIFLTALLTPELAFSGGGSSRPISSDDQSFDDSNEQETAQLSSEQLSSIENYTMGRGIWLNEILRSKSEAELPEEIKAERDTINEALSSLPTYDTDKFGSLVRGENWKDIEEAKQHYSVGKVITQTAFTSTSKTEAYPGNVNIVVVGNEGRDISEYSAFDEDNGQPDQEVLFPAGTRFEVLDSTTYNDRDLFVTLKAYPSDS